MLWHSTSFSGKSVMELNRVFTRQYFFFFFFFFFVFFFDNRFFIRACLHEVLHCVKSVQIRSFSGPYFPVFSPNKGKYGSEKTLYLDTFHAVLFRLKGTWFYHALASKLQCHSFKLLKLVSFQFSRLK